MTLEELRQARESEVDELKQLAIDTIRSTSAKDYSPDHINVWTRAIENSGRWVSCIQNQYFLVAEADQKIVGFGSLEAGSYVDFMYVHKDFTRKGIAKKIFHTLLQRSLDSGVSEMTTHASKTAVPFFESIGFEIVRPNKHIIQEVEITNFLMARSNGGSKIGLR